MSVEFKYLFSPIDVGPMKLKNRIVSTPHTSYFARNYIYDERELYYQLEKAKGGTGMLCNGIQVVDSLQVPITYHTMVPNIDESVIPWYKRISQAVHEYGAKYVAELGDEGSVFATRYTPWVAPLETASAIAVDKNKEVPVEIDRAGIERKARLFGEAAARCKEGGCDGIVIHAAHGEFFMTFMSPLFNKRTDEFSGSMENRLKPLLMAIDEMRKHMGQDLALGIRISADEFMEGGLTIDDAKLICQILEKSGKVDWLDISSGNHGEYLSRGLQGGSMYLPLGAMVPLSAAIREVVKIPVLAVGRITDPIQAEKILADGHADLVGMCRAIIADPHLPNKARAGQLEDIRYCVGATECCTGRSARGVPICCLQNPVIGREKDWAELKPAAVKKKVMVIGGGPAGMEAARVAAARGHTVALYEKSGELGGQVLISAKAPTRQEIIGVTRWLVLQAQKLGVKVNLNTEVTAEMVIKENPDVVIVATGANAARFTVPGATPQNLVDERSVLTGKAAVGQRIVLLDGTENTPGSSTAEFLADQGKQVYMLAKGYQVGAEIDEVTKPMMYRSLLDRGVVMLPFTWIRSISGKDVITYNTFTYKEDKLENIDTVVAAMPAEADNGLYKALKGKVKELYAVGDCVTPRRIQNAFFDGAKVGREV